MATLHAINVSNHLNMKQITQVLSILLLLSCNSKKVKYSGLNDLTVGVQQIVLYENGDFYLELALGGENGKFQIINDTIFLNYASKPEGWPDKISMTQTYFETISVNANTNGIRIKKTDNNYESIKPSLELDLSKEFHIENLIKSNDYPSSMVDTIECAGWELNEAEIKEILNNVKPISGREWHNHYGHWNCCMNGELIQNNLDYKLSINAGAWLTLMNNDTTYIFGQLDRKLEHLFLSNSWTLEEME